MRISDWSSDVCSSDLRAAAAEREQAAQGGGTAGGDAAPAVPGQPAAGNSTAETTPQTTPAATAAGSQTPAAQASRAYANDNTGLNRLVGQVEIGRASGRERVCQYV